MTKAKELKAIAELISSAKSVTILTGAGVSTDSGIPDFKTNDEIWPYERPRTELISVKYFHQDPKRFWEVYRAVFSSKFDAKPNGVHEWIASLENKDRLVTVITQNVDGLHQAAGSTRVIEVHGNLTKAKCPRCGHTETMEAIAEFALPRCVKCNKPLKPTVVLFGDQVKGIPEATGEVYGSELFITMGTSLDVGPINQLPDFAMHMTLQPRLWLSRDAVPELFSFTHEVLGELGDFVKSMKKLS